MNTTLFINAFFLAHPFSGQGVYTTQILNEIALQHTDPIVLLVPEETSYLAAENFAKQYPHISVSRYTAHEYLPKIARLFLYEAMWIPSILQRQREQYIYFSPYAHPLFRFPRHGRHFMTLHDAIFFRDQSYSQKATRKIYNWFIRRTVCSHQLQLLTVSHTSAEDIVQTLRPAHKPLVALNGVDHLIHEPLLSREETLTRFGIPGKYIFYHGGYDKRKNVPQLFEVYKEMDQDWTLVLGGKQLYSSTLYDTIPSQECIVQTGFISQSELRSLYHHAECYVSLSRDEGFNIPVGESLLEGTPAIVSDIPVHRELWSEHAHLVSLQDNNNIKKIIREYAGRTSSKPMSLTWASCARKILEYFG